MTYVALRHMPERRLASMEARAVRIPGTEGDMTAMPDHAPTITTLRPGILTVETASGSEEYLVTGGFAEIGAEGTTVLAEIELPQRHLFQVDRQQRRGVPRPAAGQH